MLDLIVLISDNSLSITLNCAVKMTEQNLGLKVQLPSFLADEVR